jgi:hypothetical protein
VFGTTLGATQLNAAADVPGTFTYSPAAGTLLQAGARELSVSFRPNDLANYVTTTASVPLDVAKATPIVTWSNPAGITYAPRSARRIDMRPPMLLERLRIHQPPAACLTPARKTLSLTFTPNDSANYNTAHSQRVHRRSEGNADVIRGRTRPASPTARRLSRRNSSAPRMSLGDRSSYSPAAVRRLVRARGPCRSRCTPTDGVNYTPASAGASIVGRTEGADGADQQRQQGLWRGVTAFAASGTGFVNGDSMARSAGRCRLPHPRRPRASPARTR